MSRMTKTLKSVRQELKRVKEKHAGVEESPLDISSIEKASFFQGEQYSPHGNPLHSTALEEDLSPGPEQNQKSAPEKTGQRKTGPGVAQASKTRRYSRVTQDKETSKTKTLMKNAGSKENQEPVQPTNSGAKSMSRNTKVRQLPTISEGTEGAGKKRTSVSAKSVSKNAAKGQRSAEDGSSTPGESQRPQISSEELTDEDESFHPSKEKSKRLKSRSQSSSSQRRSGHKQKRKSSSGSSEGDGRPKKQRDMRNPTDLDVVLDTFQEFVTQYKQTVSSDTVKHAIDAFSRSFQEQLSEMNTATKEFKYVKWENAKLNSAINKKRTRLVEAKSELIKGKTKLRSLQKDHDELEDRLKALKEGAAFLTNLQELNKKYLKHRTAHPDELETYGPSCLPAMLLEARCIMGTEYQLKTVNDQLQQVLDDKEK